MAKVISFENMLVWLVHLEWKEVNQRYVVVSETEDYSMSQKEVEWFNEWIKDKDQGKGY